MKISNNFSTVPEKIALEIYYAELIYIRLEEDTLHLPLQRFDDNIQRSDCHESLLTLAYKHSLFHQVKVPNALHQENITPRFHLEDQTIQIRKKLICFPYKIENLLI